MSINRIEAVLTIFRVGIDEIYDRERAVALNGGLALAAEQGRLRVHLEQHVHALHQVVSRGGGGGVNTTNTPLVVE